MIISLLFIFFFGLTVGSFLGAYTYRLPRGLSIHKGRSFCPNCKAKILWYDNIPLLSYLLLQGKCRYCRRKISLRYPLIEFSTGLLFVAIYLISQSCRLPLQGHLFKESQICFWTNLLEIWSLPYFIAITGILISIFVIDLEFQIIPDNLVLLLIIISFTAHFLSANDKLFMFLLSGFGAATFLLFLNLITNGGGMGLGDVKLVVPLGFILGFPYIILSLYISFVIGAFVGVFLIILGRAKFGKHIAFGPFLIFGFWTTFFLGEYLRTFLIPFLK